MINELPKVYNVKCIDNYLNLDLKRQESPKIYWDVLDSIESGLEIEGITTKTRNGIRNYLWVENGCEELASELTKTNMYSVYWRPRIIKMF
jgi:hypothetical protein